MSTWYKLIIVKICIYIIIYIWRSFDTTENKNKVNAVIYKHAHHIDQQIIFNIQITGQERNFPKLAVVPRAEPIYWIQHMKFCYINLYTKIDR